MNRFSNVGRARSLKPSNVETEIMINAFTIGLLEKSNASGKERPSILIDKMPQPNRPHPMRLPAIPIAIREYTRLPYASNSFERLASNGGILDITLTQLPAIP